MLKYEDLLGLVPSAPEWKINWEAVWALWPEFAALDSCPQDPVHHAEGDAGEHTRMVVEALVADQEWRDLPEDVRNRLFWTACLHDIGKPDTTVHEEDGSITSKGHSRVGASIARRLLREVEGVPFSWREKLCEGVLRHQYPFWFLTKENYEREALKAAVLISGRDLCIHARADCNGRKSDGVAAYLENVELVGELYKELGCYDAPYQFPNDESRVAFVESDERHQSYTAHEDFRCKAVVLAGLPGSGKDTWIRENVPDLPVVCMDDIRAELGISPSANQGRVYQEAMKRARTHLARKEDFVWNATNLNARLREKLMRILRNYEAEIEHVYIEVSPAELWRRNRERGDKMLPSSVLEGMIRKLEPPTILEGHRVQVILNGKKMKPSDWLDQVSEIAQDSYQSTFGNR